MNGTTPPPALAGSIAGTPLERTLPGSEHARRDNLRRVETHYRVTALRTDDGQGRPWDGDSCRDGEWDARWVRIAPDGTRTPEQGLFVILTCASGPVAVLLDTTGRETR